MDSIESLGGESTEEELQWAAYTVVFHPTQATQMGHPMAKQMSKVARGSTNTPVPLLNHFSLFLCLPLASVRQYRGALLNKLVDCPTSLDVREGRRSLAAPMPVARLSRPLRDSLILVVRKSLFSRVLGVAVSGVLLLLRTFKLPSGVGRSGALSQLSQQWQPQLAVEVHRGVGVVTQGVGRQEALCLELLGVLKKCICLQPQV